MSILRNSNSGLSNIELTVDVATSLGWVVTTEQSTFHFKQNNLVKCTKIVMNNENVYLPLYFYFEDDKQMHVHVGFKFLGDKELFGLTHFSSSQRVIKTARDLLDCAEFVKQVDECNDKIKTFWFNHIMKFEDPYAYNYKA